MKASKLFKNLFVLAVASLAMVSCKKNEGDSFYFADLGLYIVQEQTAGGDIFYARSFFVTGGDELATASIRNGLIPLSGTKLNDNYYYYYYATGSSSLDITNCNGTYVLEATSIEDETISRSAPVDLKTTDALGEMTVTDWNLSGNILTVKIVAEGASYYRLILRATDETSYNKDSYGTRVTANGTNAVTVSYTFDGARAKDLKIYPAAEGKVVCLGEPIILRTTDTEIPADE